MPRCSRCAEMDVAGGDRPCRSVGDRAPRAVRPRRSSQKFPAARHAPVAPRSERPTPAARSSQRRRIAPKPRPPSQTFRAPPTPRKAREKLPRRDLGAAGGERGRGIGHALRRVQHIDADADDHAAAAPGTVTASSRMPATFAPSTSTSFGHLRRSLARDRRHRRAPNSAQRPTPPGSIREGRRASPAKIPRGRNSRISRATACAERRSNRRPRSRPRPRASSRFATLAQATSNSTLTAPLSAASVGRTRPATDSSRGVTNTPIS